jgi:hypothetical protein
MGTAVAVLATASLAAGASADGSVPARAAKTPALASMLLTVTQMPTGWSIDNSSSSPVDLGCLSHLTPIGVKKTATAGVAFAFNASLPEFSETLATYATPASSVVRKAVSEIDRCHTITGTTQGHKFTGTLGAMSFPQYGNQSAAWALSFTLEGITFGDAILAVRKGAIVALFTEGALGSPDLRQFQGFVRKALERVK